MLKIIGGIIIIIGIILVPIKTLIEDILEEIQSKDFIFFITIDILFLVMFILSIFEIIYEMF